MAKIYDNTISTPFDVYGCPQRRKHCWKLGNLISDKWYDILKYYVHDSTTGLKAMTSISIGALVKKYGKKDSKRVFVSEKEYAVYLLKNFFKDAK